MADGVEEMEAVIIIDTLRRAEWDVTSAGFKKGVVTASRGVKIEPDALWEDVDAGSFDVIAIPGGKGGADNLRANQDVLNAVREFHSRGKPLASVCAGPLVLKEAGVLDGKRVTCHPSVTEEIRPVERVDEPVVVDGNIITSQGAGTCFEFALAIIESIDGRSKADKIGNAMVVHRIRSGQS